MSIEIKMPELSPTMTKGLLANWLVNVGSEVKVGDVIAEVETDKVTVEIESQADGVVAQINTEVGAEADVNAVIMVLNAPGSASTQKTTAQSSAPNPQNITLAVASDAKTQIQAEARQTSNTESTSTNSVIELPPQLHFSPLAKRMALQQNIDTSELQGTGAKGKIVKRDIEKLLGNSVEQATVQINDTSSANANAPAIIPATATTASIAQPDIAMHNGQSTLPPIDTNSLPAHTSSKNSAMRNVVAERLTASSRDIPHFHMTVDCHIDELLALRKQLNERQQKDRENIQCKISLNDFVIKSVATAMKKVPQANCMWANDSVIYFDQVDIAMAVALNDGLITPVLKNVSSMGLGDIASSSKSLATKAREGKLQPDQYQGGTFTISNLGMYGIKSFTSIINPPQNGILSVGAGEQRPAVINGELSVATVMTVTLAMDHRCVDGAIGAQFIQAFKRIIEDPLSLLL